MKSLFDDLPRFCPVCGQPQDFDAVRRTAYLNGYAPQVAVEFGRKVLYSADRPGFLELEEHVKQKK